MPRAVLLEEMALAAMVDKLKAAMPQRPSVAILGGTRLHNDLSRPLIEELGRTFAERLRGKVNFITGGNLGVQGLFTKSSHPLRSLGGWSSWRYVFRRGRGAAAGSPRGIHPSVYRHRG